MGVFTGFVQHMRNGTKYWSGQFAVAGGAITAGTTKFKGFATVARNSAGLYTFSMFKGPNLTDPYTAKRLSEVVMTFITPPGGAGEGGWQYNLNADSVLTAGTFQMRINAQAFTVADPVQTVRIRWVTEDEVA